MIKIQKKKKDVKYKNVPIDFYTCTCIIILIWKKKVWEKNFFLFLEYASHGVDGVLRFEVSYIPPIKFIHDDDQI